MKKKDSWLPIGTVVKVHGYENQIMIYGRTQMSGNEYFDYVACQYPRGNISAHYNVFFNKRDIETVVFLGYVDENEKMLALSMD